MKRFTINQFNEIREDGRLIAIAVSQEEGQKIVEALEYLESARESARKRAEFYSQNPY